jgi:hypothetical protein
MVQQGLQGNTWATAIEGDLSVDAVAQPTSMGRCYRMPAPTPEQRLFPMEVDQQRRLHGLVCLSCLLRGHHGVAEPATNIWDSFVPMAYRMHAWLALRRRCWTVDRRLRRGLHSHVLCPMCTTMDETIDHLFVGCVFSHRVWAGVNLLLGFNLAAPSQDGTLADWWPSTVKRLPSGRRKDGNSIIMLVIRSIWLERNARVFDGKASVSDVVLDMVVDTWGAWMVTRGRQPRGVP